MEQTAATSTNRNPEHCDILLFGGRVLDLDSTTGQHENYGIAIAGDSIVAIGPSDKLRREWVAERAIDVRGNVISPGFVDAHVHLSAYLAAAMPYARSTAPGVFSGGSNVSEIVPFVAEMTMMQLPVELTETVLNPVFAAMVKSGITSVVDAGSSGHVGIANAAATVGIRASIGPSLADRWHDKDGVIGQRADHNELLDQARSVIEMVDACGDDRIRPLISAVETIACSDEMLASIATLANELDIPTHIHSHITCASDAAHLQEYEATASRRLVDTGFYSERCTAMHAGNTDDLDIAAMLDSGVTVNHNPFGNAMFGFATARRGSIPKMIDAGVPIVLGSDYAGSMIASPFDSIRAALAIHREAGGADDTLSLEDAVAMATNPGVPIGRPGMVGKLAVGQLADVVVIDTSGSHHLGDRHAVPSTALRAQPSDVTTVIINGNIVVSAGEVLTVDESEATANAQTLLASLR